jgi:hypothetical protein
MGEMYELKNEFEGAIMCLRKAEVAAAKVGKQLEEETIRCKFKIASIYCDRLKDYPKAELELQKIVAL